PGCGAGLRQALRIRAGAPAACSALARARPPEDSPQRWLAAAAILTHRRRGGRRILYSRSGGSAWSASFLGAWPSVPVDTGRGSLSLQLRRSAGLRPSLFISQLARSRGLAL